MASFKTRSLITIIISTNLLHFGVTDDSAHYFTLPEGCSNDGVSTDPWTCLWYNWGNMSCWFSIENLFHYQMDVGVNISSIVFYEIGGFYKTKKITSIGKCLMIKDDLELSGHCYFNITLMSPGNKRLRTEVIGFESRHFVKPPKIKGFQYNTTKTSLSLQFQLVRNVYEKEIRIRYRSEYDGDKENGWQFSDYIFHMQLRNLTAFTSYDMIVDLIPCYNGTREGFWSDHFNITVKTDDDVPSDVPEFYPGYFTHINSSYLQIYWKPISPVKRCGIITNYRVTVNNVGNDETRKKKIIMISPDKTSYGLSVDPNQINRIELTQKTRLGYPNKSDAGIYVFPENLHYHYRKCSADVCRVKPRYIEVKLTTFSGRDGPKIPKTFSINAVIDSRVVMTWGIIGPVKQHGLLTEFSSITVVWCYGTLPGYCSKPIKSREISLRTKTTPNNTTITVDIGNVWNYIYGISVEAETNDRRLISSGIHWYKDCLYSQDGMPIMAPRAHASWYSHSKMLVKWEPYTCVQSVVEIDKYLIKYCETTGKNCTGETRMEIIPPDVYSHIINGLKEGHSYAIQVGTKLKHGKYRGHWSAKIYLDIPPLNLSDKLQLVIGFVVGGVITSVILIILAIFFIRRYLKQSSAGVAEINMPHMKRTRMNGTIHQSESEESSGKKDASSNDSGIGSNLQHNSGLLSDPLGSVSSVKNLSIHDLNEDVLFNSDLSKPPVQVDSDEDVQGLDTNISSNTLNSAGYREVDMVSSSDDELELSLLSSDSG